MKNFYKIQELIAKFGRETAGLVGREDSKRRIKSQAKALQNLNNAIKELYDRIEYLEERQEFIPE